MHSYIFLFWEASCSAHTHSQWVWAFCRKVFILGRNEKVYNYSNYIYFFLFTALFFFSPKNHCFFVPILKLRVTDLLWCPHTVKHSSHPSVAHLPQSSACPSSSSRWSSMEGASLEQPELVWCDQPELGLLCLPPGTCVYFCRFSYSFSMDSESCTVLCWVPLTSVDSSSRHCWVMRPWDGVSHYVLPLTLSQGCELGTNLGWPFWKGFTSPQPHALKRWSFFSVAFLMDVVFAVAVWLWLGIVSDQHLLYVYELLASLWSSITAAVLETTKGLMFYYPLLHSAHLCPRNF